MVASALPEGGGWVCTDCNLAGATRQSQRDHNRLVHTPTASLWWSDGTKVKVNSRRNQDGLFYCFVPKCTYKHQDPIEFKNHFACHTRDPSLDQAPQDPSPTKPTAPSVPQSSPSTSTSMASQLPAKPPGGIPYTNSLQQRSNPLMLPPKPSLKNSLLQPPKPVQNGNSSKPAGGPSNPPPVKRLRSESPLPPQSPLKHSTSRPPVSKRQRSISPLPSRPRNGRTRSPSPRSRRPRSPSPPYRRERSYSPNQRRRSYSPRNERPPSPRGRPRSRSPPPYTRRSPPPGSSDLSPTSIRQIEDRITKALEAKYQALRERVSDLEIYKAAYNGTAPPPPPPPAQPRRKPQYRAALKAAMNKLDECFRELDGSLEAPPPKFGTTQPVRKVRE